MGEAPAESVPGTSKAKTRTGKKAGSPNVLESYIDEIPNALLSDDPAARSTYAVEVLNLGKRGSGLSNQVPVSLIRTLPPPADLSAQVTAQGVALSWTNAAPAQHVPELHYVYRLCRRPEGASQPGLIDEVSSGTDQTLTFADSTIEWQKTYYYHVDTVTVIAQEGRASIEVPGDDSPEIKVFANDIFPPAVPSGLQAVSSGPGQPPFIDLIWAPDSEPDLAGYNVYRREGNGPAIKLNSELIKTPAYRDASAVPGKSYLYAISAVDVRGNESTRSEEVSETLPQN